MLFGARVKTANSNEIIDEVSSLDASGNMPSITDFRKSDSERIKQVKEKLSPEEFEKKASEYDEVVKANVLKVIRDRSYRDMAPDEKKNEVNHAVEVSLNKVLKDAGYVKPKTKRTTYIVK